ncbi:hypothetical protein PM10SUCC1_05370 [Propionigenium maris DSM 9537]|uniref:Uncharacterized protein n=1 Tax=Propionigenium maris DSM 9537 TaxID=1123000 RepID=A0A9W6LLU6_9FUSO|nr:hypothetical protein PM10SUCC1_05370 [Propionigenium maris DSM 9537]
MLLSALEKKMKTVYSCDPLEKGLVLSTAYSAPLKKDLATKKIIDNQR